MATATQAPMVSDGATGNPRGLFGLDGAVGEGMSIGTVKVFVPDRGVPGGGIGYGYFNCGVTAPEGEFADAYRDVERVYDPANNEVYEVPAGWYEDYDLSGLQRLPADDWELSMRTVLDGQAEIH